MGSPHNVAPGALEGPSPPGAWLGCLSDLPHLHIKGSVSKTSTSTYASQKHRTWKGVTTRASGVAHLLSTDGTGGLAGIGMRTSWQARVSHEALSRSCQKQVAGHAAEQPLSRGQPRSCIARPGRNLRVAPRDAEMLSAAPVGAPPEIHAAPRPRDGPAGEGGRGRSWSEHTTRVGRLGT